MAYILINLEDLEKCGPLKGLGMVKKYIKVLGSQSPKGMKLVREFMASARMLRRLLKGLMGRGRGKGKGRGRISGVMVRYY